MSENRVIDVQAHFTTPEYLDMMRKHDAFWEDGFPLPDWTPGEHLSFMDENEIEWTLLSLSSPQPYFNGYDQESIDMCHRLNETSADAKRRYPDRFGFNACLPLPNVDAAIEEAVYALDELGANGIKFASNSRGLYLGEKSLEPLMEELNRRHAICNIHPHRPEPIKEGLFSSKIVPLYEFIADTTRAVLNMVSNGVLERYPDIRWIIPHCGSFLPNIYDRFVGISEILVPQGLMEPVDVKGNFSKLYYDLSGTPAPHLLDFLLTIAKPEQIMYGCDFPFTNAKIASRNLKGFIEMMDSRQDLAAYKQMILHDNAEKLFAISCMKKDCISECFCDVSRMSNRL